MPLQSTKHFLLRYKATLGYILFILLLNKLYGTLPLYSFFDELVSPLDITVGMIYIFRDFSQREIGRYVIIAMLLAGYLSFILADQTVAYASLCAFLISRWFGCLKLCRGVNIDLSRYLIWMY